MGGSALIADEFRLGLRSSLSQELHCALATEILMPHHTRGDVDHERGKQVVSDGFEVALARFRLFFQLRRKLVGEVCDRFSNCPEIGCGVAQLVDREIGSKRIKAQGGKNILLLLACRISVPDDRCDSMPCDSGHLFQVAGGCLSLPHGDRDELAIGGLIVLCNLWRFLAHGSRTIMTTPSM